MKAEAQRKRRVVLATFGTAGDLNPFLAVALELKKRGVEPIVAAAEGYRGKVEGEGVRFQRMRPDIETLGEHLGMSERAIARAAAKRPDFIVRQIVLPHLRDAYEDVMSGASDADLIVTHSVAYGAQLAAEKCQLPQISIVLQPMLFFSIYDPPVIATSPKLSSWLYRRGFAWTRSVLALSKWIARGWMKPIDSLRAEIGLPKAHKHPLFEGQFSPLGTIALFSPVFGPPQIDHPPNTEIVGFAFYDKHSEPPNDSLERFLAAGDAPVVFTQGTSAVHDADTFIRESLAAVKASGHRAVFVLDDERAGEWSTEGGSSILITGYAPYSQLFPRASVIVHHGGIGTTAQALRAGRPQLIAPYFVDQPDNAARVERLGCGRVVPQRHYRTSRVRSEIEALMNDPRYARAAREVGARLSREHGAERAAEFIMARLANHGANVGAGNAKGKANEQMENGDA